MHVAKKLSCIVYYNERVITHHNNNKLFAGLHFIMHDQNRGYVYARRFSASLQIGPTCIKCRLDCVKCGNVLVHWSSPVCKLVNTHLVHAIAHATESKQHRLQGFYIWFVLWSMTRRSLRYVCIPMDHKQRRQQRL